MGSEPEGVEVVGERGWTDAPWTLFAYFSVGVGAWVVYWLTEPGADLPVSVARVALFVLLFAGLLARIRGVWIFSVFAEGISMIGLLNPDTFSDGILPPLLAIAMLILLVARPTREWCRVA